MYIVYVYDPNGNLLTQVFDTFNLSVTKKINDVSSCSFQLATQSYTTYLQNFNRIKIFVSVDNEEKLLFEGIIKNIQADFQKIQVDCVDYLYILQRRVLEEDKSYNNESIQNILDDIFSYINNIYDTGLSVNATASKTITKTWNKKYKIFDILKDLSKYGYDFVFKGTTLYFAEIVGEDKSTGSNYLQFRFVENDFEQSIAKIQTLQNGDNTSNSIYIKDTLYEDTISINQYGKLQSTESEGDNDILQEKKDIVREIELTPIITDFFLVNEGDIVDVEVKTGNVLLDFSGTMKVLEKNLKGGTLQKVELKLNKGKSKTPTLLEKIKELDEKVYKLENG